jgi:hypothetical protein
MTHPGKRLIVTGLVATLLLGVAYSVAYVALVRKQLTIHTATIVWGAAPATSWTFHTPYVSSVGTTTGRFTSFLEPNYTAVFGLGDGNLVDLGLAYVFYPIHLCDRHWVRTHEWEAITSHGAVTVASVPWPAVKWAE